MNIHIGLKSTDPHNSLREAALREWRLNLSNGRVYDSLNDWRDHTDHVFRVGDTVTLTFIGRRLMLSVNDKPCGMMFEDW